MMKKNQTVRGLARVRQGTCQGKDNIFTVEVAVVYPSIGELKRRTQQFLLAFLS